jgi:hypothetical protein
MAGAPTSLARGGVSRLVARGRASGLRGWRLGASIVLPGAAVVVGGAGGLLLGMAALLLALDALIPVPGAAWTEADDRFRSAVARRRRTGRLHRLRRRAPTHLDVLEDRGGWASVAERRQLGTLPIAIDSITGTVEPARASTFDRRFLPAAVAEQRWKRLWVAQARGVPLPPISVYRVGHDHIVRDGHHRVSVARDHGFATIDAEVVELRPPMRRA